MIPDVNGFILEYKLLQSLTIFLACVYIFLQKEEKKREKFSTAIGVIFGGRRVGVKKNQTWALTLLF